MHRIFGLNCRLANPAIAPPVFVFQKDKAQKECSRLQLHEKTLLSEKEMLRLRQCKEKHGLDYCFSP
uniref:Uncharacterized protein n=1 Tax=Accipiter nisus TaxID=211598 RepID=A0A8B9M8A3_9AVES